jgi:hypothetical protein
MKNEILFPIKWSGWDQLDVLFNTYYDVEFTNDFGLFKEGEKFSSISIDYSKGIIEAYDDNGEKVIKTQKYGCVPETL